MKTWRVMSTALALAALARAAQAQGPRGDAPVSVAAAIDEAVQHNLALIAQRTNLTIADAAALTARLRPNPVASVSADHLDLLGTGYSLVNNGGPPEISWRVDVPFERGRKRQARMEVATLIRNEAEAQIAEAIRQLTLEVTLACIDVMAARASRALVADTLRTFEELVRVNQTRVSAGAIAPFEATRSTVAMLQFRNTAVRANLELASATARLRSLLGRPVDAPLELSSELGDIATPTLPDSAELQRAAFEARPDLRGLTLSQARTTADLRLQEALGKIDYTLGAEYRRQQGVSGRGNSVGLFVSAPIPVFNRNQGEIARAAAARTQAERHIAARRADVAAEVARAYQEFVTNRDLAASIERDLLKPATSAREISAYTYRAGGSTLVELLDAQRAFNDTMITYAETQASLRRAASRLNAAVGMEVVR